MSLPRSIRRESLEWHQLEQPFAALRIQSPSAIARLARSIEEEGQRVPVIVAVQGQRRLLIDGYRRCAALRQMERDAVDAELWEGEVGDVALTSLARVQARVWHPLEEAGLIRDLIDLHHLSQREIARRSGRDVSWVNRRLALIECLPEPLLDAVRKGQLTSWSATRVMAPLARANSDHALSMLGTIEDEGVSSRELTVWFDYYQRTHKSKRQQLVDMPMVYIKGWRELNREKKARALCPDLPALWLTDLREIEKRCDGLQHRLIDTFEATLPEISRRNLLDAFAKTQQRIARLAGVIEAYRP